MRLSGHRINQSIVESALGDFYVQDTCCLSCGVPQAIAADLVGWTNENHSQCYWIKQPETQDELERAIKIIHAQELGCHRYAGNDPAIVRRLPAEECDYLRPDLRMGSAPLLSSSGAQPKFTLSTSVKKSSLARLWRMMRRRQRNTFQ